MCKHSSIIIKLYTDSNLVLHYWGLHLQLLPPPLPPARGPPPGLEEHPGARARARPGSALEDQRGPAGLQGAHQLLPAPQREPEVGGGGKRVHGFNMASSLSVCRLYGKYI